MTRKQNRNYKKGSPHKDFRKFVIVAEGEREDDYFSYFNSINRRIVISIVPRDQGKSACKYFLDRARKYDDEFGIEPEDQVWFIMDVDRWKRSEIEELQQHCQQNNNRHLAVSNPCFEVWLYFHFGNPAGIIPPTAHSLKQKLNTLVHGGYKKDVFAEQIKTAKSNAQKADGTPTHYYPDLLTTKVYKLATEMLKFMGNTWSSKN